MLSNMSACTVLCYHVLSCDQMLEIAIFNIAHCRIPSESTWKIISGSQPSSNTPEENTKSNTRWNIWQKEIPGNNKVSLELSMAWTCIWFLLEFQQATEFQIKEGIFIVLIVCKFIVKYYIYICTVR